MKGMGEMITCNECRERLYPEDPSIPTGRYGHSSCDYFCDKSSNYRELETIKEPIIENWSNKQWDYVEQIKSEVTGWRQKHAEMMLKFDKKRTGYDPF